MAFRAPSKRPTSSVLVTSMRELRSPAATFSATSSACATGWVMERVIHQPSSVPIAAMAASRPNISHLACAYSASPVLTSSSTTAICMFLNFSSASM
jgi:hypothetical protein